MGNDALRPSCSKLLMFVKQDKKCKLSGLTLTFALGRKQVNLRVTTASLDRKDSSCGYVRGNVQWVHKDINRMKHVFEERYFIHLCSLVTQNSKDGEGKDAPYTRIPHKRQNL